MHRASQGPLRGTVSAQKALQGYETETTELLGGKEENSIFPDEGSLICPQVKSMTFYLGDPHNMHLLMLATSLKTASAFPPSGISDGGLKKVVDK